ncbi:pectate lyase [Maribacter stanieri]|uniref:pectate lyase n=1 Tax=Maribacter stanieri TaxID=440514 RepID=UPI0030DC0123|tara:strand:+ start:12967 stop:14973 length:2007 start_codon:yes stop_codon:yes gene_type:complete
MKILSPILIIVFSMFSCFISGQQPSRSWKDLVASENEFWFATNEAIGVAENVLLLQKNVGGWAKNIQPQNFTNEDILSLIADKKKAVGATIDNGATTTEMIFLSKIYKSNKKEKYRTAFLKGLDYLLKAQYDNGGWPQFYPLRKGYYTHITFNDDAIFNVMVLLKDVNESGVYDHLNISKQTKLAVLNAFQKGIACILKTQYVQNGRLTAWCAQHDENTFVPAKARAYELPSLSGKESAKIVLLLMSIERPSPAVVKAISSAKDWFENTKIDGIRVDRFYDEHGKVSDKKVITDSTANLLWGRFMELDDNRVFFCDRDGIKKYALSEIGSERRNGYRWYTNEPQEVLNAYPIWKSNVEAKFEKKSKLDIYNMVVAKNGSGDFKTIQEAINAAKGFPDKCVTIKVKNGVYKEKVSVYEWNTNTSIIGENTEQTIISYDDCFDDINLGRNSTFHTPTFSVQGNDFYMANLTIENTAGEVGQAVALSVNATRVKIENCIIKGNQDTLYTTGEGFRQYYKDCYIEGTTDFIFGQATALFENCEIHSKSNSFITAASTPKGVEFGYVFKNCRLTAAKNVTEVFLGRPWRTYAKTVFLETWLDEHIVEQGWDNWSNIAAQKQSFYAEYNNMGPGYQPKLRQKWSHQLTKKQAKFYTNAAILYDKLNQDWYLNKN